MGHGDHNRSLFSLVCRDYCDSKSLIIYIILNKLACVPHWLRQDEHHSHLSFFFLYQRRTSATPSVVSRHENRVTATPTLRVYFHFIDLDGHDEDEQRNRTL